MTVRGLVFSIQRFSIHDGPGIRTTVFLKGCPLRCFWCHNPEGLRPRREVQFFAERCIGCGACVEVCPNGAQQILPDGARTYNRETCAVCGACVDMCFAEGLQIAGEERTVEEVVEETLRDRAFYDSSGGGVTLSGGEPLLQPAFSLAILRALKAADVHTAVETTTFCSWDHLEAALPYIDLLMVDLKLLDSARHKAATGVPNERILAHVQRLAGVGKPVIFRVPVIPTVNDTAEDIGEITAYVRRLSKVEGAGPVSLELLAFHRLAGDKYHSLGLEDRAAHLLPPTPEHMHTLGQVAQAHGIPVLVK